ncbi:MAG: phage minor head protein [Pseudomonadota bacterium]|nr:phage minor head protein [Pseudomonadota bacterium]
MARQPILPRNEANPPQTTRQIQRAFKQIDGALKQIEAGVLERFEQIRYTVRTGNAEDDRNSTYEYLLDQFVLDDMNTLIAELINEYVMRAINGEPIVIGQVELSYEQSTAGAVLNIAAQTDAFQRTVEQTLMSAPYRTRIALVRARVFEEMQGFTDQTRTDLARTLADGMALGQSPVQIARSISDRIGVAKSRAERIARTEINVAHRRAIIEEDQQVNDEGIRTALLWFSALSPTTRANHARRHGRLYTRQEVNDFYSRDGNAINCKCSVRSVLTDENGKPLVDTLPNRLQLQGAKFFKDAA